MSDRERLDEALSRFEVTTREVIDGQEGSWVAPATLDDVLEVFEAASSYRDLLANGQRVEWCETHRTSTSRLDGLCEWGRLRQGDDDPILSPCSIVSKLLIDPPKEEEKG